MPRGFSLPVLSPANDPDSGPDRGEPVSLPQLPRPRLLGWRRHDLTLLPVEGGMRLVSSRGFLPTGPCLLSMWTRAPVASDLHLLSRQEGSGDKLVHEFQVQPGERWTEHLVALPTEAAALVLRSMAGAAPPAVARVRLLELGTASLTALLSAQWLRRQLQQPERLGEKLRNLLSVFRREGVRAAVAGVVASQVARQSEQPWEPDAAPAPTVSWEPHGPPPTASPPWEGHRFLRAGTTKGAFDAERHRDLSSFLATDDKIELPSPSAPTVSIVVVTFNRAELSLACLRHVADSVSVPSQVIVVDNASTDRTREVLGRLEGGLVVENDSNVGFLRACNQAAELAAGRYMLLLNSDAFLLPGALEAAVSTLERDSNVGVVGGPIVSLDGRLQEAGSLLWRDGGAQGYGRGGDPGRPEYRFRREVDFVSGAFLLTRRDLWRTLDGFDESYAPAYYEDADYCLRAWRIGARVVYEPMAPVLHYEYGSSGGPAAVEAMRRNRRIFAACHSDHLSARPDPSPKHVLAARTTGRRGRVLVMDDRVPLSVMGSGSPRMAAIIESLVRLGREVTFFPGLPFTGSWEEVYAEVPREVEVMLGWDRRFLGRFLDERRGHYGHVLVSRAHNMAILNGLLERYPELLGEAVLVYDAEAIGAMRAVTQPAARGRPLSDEEADRLIQAEVTVARQADRVASVSPVEAEAFRDGGVPQVHVLSHAVKLRPTRRPFEGRRHLLFVGRLLEDFSPNVDGLQWFLEEVWPQLRGEFDDPPPELLVAGRTSPTLLARNDAGVRFLGPVDDLTPLYDGARLFIAPLRFSAGIPLKILEAASYGVPVVTTDLLCSQLGWSPQQDLLSCPVGDARTFKENCLVAYRDPSLWTSLRESALRQVTATATMDRFKMSVERLLAPANRGDGKRG